MAPKITSSSDRAKRQSRSKAIVRSDKGRANRQKASTVKQGTSRTERQKNGNARVTRDSQRASTGSAKVTRSEKPALPPGNKGGAIQQKGGPIVRREPSTPAKAGSKGTATSSRVQQVSVRDVTKGRQQGQRQGPAPATRRQAAQAKADTAARGSTGPNRVGQPAGAANRVYGADRVNDAVGRAQRQAAMRKAMGRGVVGGTIAGAILSAPEEIRKGVRLVQGKAGGDFKDSMNDMGITIYGEGPRTRGQRQQQQQSATKRQSDNQARLAANERVKAGRVRAATPVPPTRSANDAQATRQAEQRRSSGSTTAAPAPRQSPARPSQAQPRSASGTAGTGRKWEDFNPGRGTSETNNPLMKNDSWLMSKIKEREDKQAKNVGPVKDGGEYSASKKSAEIVARRKKKEEDEKKKQQP